MDASRKSVARSGLRQGTAAARVFRICDRPDEDRTPTARVLLVAVACAALCASAFAAATPIVTVTGGSLARRGAETPSVIAVGGFLYCIYNDQPIRQFVHNPGSPLPGTTFDRWRPGSWLKLSGGNSAQRIEQRAFDDISPTPPRGSATTAVPM